MCEREGVCQFTFWVNMQEKNIKICLFYVVRDLVSNLPTLLAFSLILLYHSFYINNNKAGILILHRQRASSCQSLPGLNPCMQECLFASDSKFINQLAQTDDKSMREQLI